MDVAAAASAIADTAADDASDGPVEGREGFVDFVERPEFEGVAITGDENLEGFLSVLLSEYGLVGEGMALFEENDVSVVEALFVVVIFAAVHRLSGDVGAPHGEIAVVVGNELDIGGLAEGTGGHGSGDRAKDGYGDHALRDYDNFAPNVDGIEGTSVGPCVGRAWWAGAIRIDKLLAQFGFREFEEARKEGEARPLQLGDASAEIAEDVVGDSSAACELLSLVAGLGDQLRDEGAFRFQLQGFHTAILRHLCGAPLVKP